MITAERNRVSGHYVVSALVNDGRGAWYLSRQYYGYPKRVAIALFREYCQGNNIEIVKGVS
jgi:hypothetical protein